MPDARIGERAVSWSAALPRRFPAWRPGDAGLAFAPVHAALRFLALLNAAVWLGATVFFTVLAGPAFFGPEMSAFLPRPHRARAAELIIARLFMLQQICGGIALTLLLMECVRAGRLVRRAHLALVGGLLVCGLLAGNWLAPRMHQLQRIRYAPNSTPAQVAAAEASFNRWHAFSQVVNLLVIAGLVVHLWAVSRPPETPRLGNLFRPQPPADGTVPRML